MATEATFGRAHPDASLGISTITWPVELLGLAVVCLAALNSGLFYLHPPTGWVDPGLYIFSFQNLSTNFAEYGADYHNTRLPFIALGWLSYRVFEPVLAQTIFVNLCYGVGLLGLYAVARAVVVRQSFRLAFVLLIALNPIWIRAFAEGYVDGLAIAFGLLALASALRAGEPDWSRGLAAGVAAGLCVATHPVPGIFASIAVFALFASTARRPRDLLAVVTGAFCGGAGTLLAMGLASASLGGPFLFLLPGAAMGARTLSTSGSAFTLPHSAWLFDAPGAIVAVVAVVSVGAALAMQASLPSDRRLRGLIIVNALGILTLALAELNERGFLQFRFYASYVLLIVIPMLALLIAMAGGADRRRDALLAGALVTAAAPILYFGPGLALGFVWAVLLAGCALMAVAFMASLPRLALASVLMVLGLAAVVDPDLRGVSSSGNPANPRLQAQFAARMTQAVAAAGLAGHRTLTWFNRENFQHASDDRTVKPYRLHHGQNLFQFSVFDGAAATLGWDKSSLGFAMPDLEGASYRQFQKLTPRPTALALFCLTEKECLDAYDLLAQEASIRISRRLMTRIEIPGLPMINVMVSALTSPPAWTR